MHHEHGTGTWRLPPATEGTAQTIGHPKYAQIDSFAYAISSLPPLYAHAHSSHVSRHPTLLQYVCIEAWYEPSHCCRPAAAGGGGGAKERVVPGSW